MNRRGKSARRKDRMHDYHLLLVQTISQVTTLSERIQSSVVVLCLTIVIIEDTPLISCAHRLDTIQLIARLEQSSSKIVGSLYTMVAYARLIDWPCTAN
jgi:hypothetical protein